MSSLPLEIIHQPQICLTLAIGLLTVLFLFILLQSKRPNNYPSGPFRLPIIGNLHNLGTQPFKSFRSMKDKYGNVFAVDFGSYPAITLNDHYTIKKYLNMVQTTGRPHVLPFIDRSPDGVPRGIGACEGDLWIEQRRFVIRNLRNFGFGKKSMESLINDEVTELLNIFRTSIGQPIETENIFNRVVLNALYTICIGERSSDADQEFETILKSINHTSKNSSFAGVLWFFPKICKQFPLLSGYRYLMSWSVPMLESIRSKISEHEKTFTQNIRRDLIDCYIAEIKKTNNPNSVFYNKNEAEQHMTIGLQDLFMAGAETTSTTLSWTFLILALYPEIQEKLHNEIDNVIGSSKPSLAHRTEMPYYQCLIMEVLRFAPTLPLGLPHSVTETMEIEGYTIPKGTMIMSNLYGAHHNSDVWGQEVDQIKPERFLSEDGKSVIKNHEAFIAFSAGKRICLGEGLAKDSLFLFITSVFQVFRVALDPNGPTPTLDFRVGTTLSPKQHKLILYERSS